MGQGHARTFWLALLAFAALALRPAQAASSERAAAKRELAGARKAVAVEVAREVRRSSPMPPVTWAGAPVSPTTRAGPDARGG